MRIQIGTPGAKPELQLIADSRNGDVDAMAELFQRHYASSLRLACRILGDDSLDAVQSAYLSAFRNFASFRGDSSFKTWLTKIVTNQCLVHLRKSSRRRWVSLDQSLPGSAPPTIIDKAPTPEDLAVSADILRKVLDTAGRLPRRLRDVFVLSAIGGLSMAETAEALGLTLPATKTRMFRARSVIRSELRDIRGKADKTVSTAKQSFLGQRRPTSGLAAA